jgi:phosphatidate cytidylyltransferase
MKRIATALVLIPAIVWTVLYAPYWVFLIVLGVVGGLAYCEFDNIAASQSMTPGGFVRMTWIGIALGIALIVVPERMALVVLVLAALVMMGLAMLSSDLSKSLSSAAAGTLGILYIFGAWRCAIGIRGINPHWLMLTLLVSWAGDTAAMYTGKAIGRRRMAPVISPGKTWEGAAGSLAGGMITAGVYAHFFIEPAPVWAVLATGAAANIAGQIGDLAESAFKRGASVKDSGSTLPGHGGWLDRIDSSLFAIPIVYGIFKLILDLN